MSVHMAGQSILGILAFWGAAVVAGTAAGYARDRELKRYLETVAPNYGETCQMLGTKFSSPGYHSHIAQGTWVHPTRQSLDYAEALLTREAPGDVERAAAVIRAVLRLQDTNRENDTFGIWPWVLEEPLAEMTPPDWNWADFCGARLVTILHKHGDRLPAPLGVAIRKSIGYAAAAIRRRNVQPNYTNIAIMGGGVCAAVGEMTGDADMLYYGRTRLQQVVAQRRHTDGFNEYNSPTYSMVALWETERTLYLVRDEATRAAAETLRQLIWHTIADSFHPATGQWAGPHSRAYADHLLPIVVDYLNGQTGANIRVHPSVRDRGRIRPPMPFPHQPCPAELRPRFPRLPANRLQLRRTFIRGSMTVPSVVGTTWLSRTACLGSASQSTLWTQRRPLIGYWRTPADPAIVFRVRFLHDGRDFASMAVRVAQSGPRALLVAYPLRHHGDWHESLDRPRDGTFFARDLRLRFELTGRDTSARRLDANCHALSAGAHRVVVHALADTFNGQAVRWAIAQTQGKAAVDAVCYRGAPRRFDFRRLDDVALAAGIELIARERAIAQTPPRWEAYSPGQASAVWSVKPPLRVTARFPVGP